MGKFTVQWDICELKGDNFRCALVLVHVELISHLFAPLRLLMMVQGYSWSYGGLT